MQMTWFCFGKSEEDLRVIVGCFIKVYRSGLKVDSGKSKVMVLNGEGLHIWDKFRAYLRI